MANYTINDIARLANVSPAAVSYVINDRPGVSPQTREAIQKIIKETGYNPNLSSRKLVLNKSFNIHIVIGSAFASFDNLFYNTAIKRMMEVCTESGYNLVLSNTENFENSALRRAIQQKDVDGVIFLQDVVHGAVSYLHRHKVPYVVLDAHELIEEHNSVYCDYSKAAYTATEYLISKGHRGIGFVGMNSIQEFFDSSRKGYECALLDAGVTPSASWVHGGTDDENSMHACASAFIKLIPDVSAVLCATDVIAVTFIKQLSKLGILVPDDLSVCGMDDVLIARYSTPSLSTVEIDKQKMGETAIRLLLDMIDNKVPQKGQNVCINGEKIIERESVCIKK